MNLNRLIRFYLLLLFALLQCVAPFAHAHVDGNNADHNIHLASIESAWVTAHNSDAAHLAIEPDHSAVVCMPPAYRGSDLAIAQAVTMSDKQLFAACEHRVVSFVTFHQLILSSVPYQHPCSQAPPA